jgi:lysophospholipase L1-like esterase
VWLVFSQPSYEFFLSGIVGLMLAGYALLPLVARQNQGGNLFLSLAALNLLLLTPEIGLRIFDFHYEMGIEFAHPTSFQRLALDEDLFWTLPPNETGVNGWGFKGENVIVPKPVGVCRILFLGDSVPGQGYPELVERLLKQRYPQQKIEVVNLALAGYSSWQGRAVVDKYGTAVAPEVVVVSYGWNDHWLAYGSVDSQKVITTQQSRGSQLFAWLYRRVRLLQGGRYIVGLFSGLDKPLLEVRVSRTEYEANLTYIGNFFAAKDIPIILVTPPGVHLALGVPDYLIEGGFARDKASVIALHQAYNESVRAVGVAQQWLILDLEHNLASAPNLSEIFLSDGIHLTEAGLGLVAQQVADFIAAQVKLERCA